LGIVFFDKTPFPEPILNDETHFVVSRKAVCGKIFEIFEKVKEYRCSFALFSMQMHGYIAKYKDGSLSEYVSWRDKSGDKEQDKFVGVNFNDFGLTLANNLPVTKIDGDTVREFYTLGSYLAYILTGNNATHITDAFASGFYYSPSGQPNAFAKGMIMPSVCASSQVVGEYEGLKILCPFGDHQISFLGSDAQTNAYLINIGTGAQVCCLAPYGYPDGAYQKRPYFNEEYCLYSFCGLHGVDGKSRDKEGLLERIVNAVLALPKKKTAIVGGGGGEELFPFIQEKLAVFGIALEKPNCNIGTQGLVFLANEYFEKTEK
jgi:hypothetical protein